MNRMKSLPISSLSTIQEDSGWRSKLWLRIGQRSVWLINLNCTEAYWTVIHIKCFILISTLQLQLSINSPKLGISAIFGPCSEPDTDHRGSAGLKAKWRDLTRSVELKRCQAAQQQQLRSQGARDNLAGNGMRTVCERYASMMNPDESSAFSKLQQVWTYFCLNVDDFLIEPRFLWPLQASWSQKITATSICLLERWYNLQGEYGIIGT